MVSKSCRLSDDRKNQCYGAYLNTLRFGSVHSILKSLDSYHPEKCKFRACYD